MTSGGRLFRKYVLWTMALVADHGVTWGSAILEDDAYTYVYGVETVPWHKFLHVARAPRGAVTGGWEFFDGTGWSSDPGASARVLDHVSDQLTVLKWGGGYRVVSQADMFSRDVFVYSSSSPAGTTVTCLRPASVSG